MPVYEYTCKDCKKRFELIQSFAEHDDRKIRCPKCKGKRIERVWGTVEVHTSKKS